MVWICNCGIFIYEDLNYFSKKDLIKKNHPIFINIYQGKINFWFFKPLLIILIKYFNILKYREYKEVDEKNRFNLFLISFHYLLHVIDSIEDFGPYKGYWQFSIERMCGILIPLVKSQIYSYANFGIIL